MAIAKLLAKHEIFLGKSPYSTVQVTYPSSQGYCVHTHMSTCAHTHTHTHTQSYGFLGPEGRKYLTKVRSIRALS